MAATDKKTLDLIALVNKQKAEIAKADKPNWRTNCSFSFFDGKMTDAVNLHVESDVRKLVSIAAFVTDRENGYKAAGKVLGVDNLPEFAWNGYTVADWLEDLKTRITKIQITAKRKKLEELEARLNKIISPEKRAELELEAIEAALQ